MQYIAVLGNDAEWREFVRKETRDYLIIYSNRFVDKTENTIYFHIRSAIQARGLILKDFIMLHPSFEEEQELKARCRDV